MQHIDPVFGREPGAFLQVFYYLFSEKNGII